MKSHTAKIQLSSGLQGDILFDFLVDYNGVVRVFAFAKANLFTILSLLKFKRTPMRFITTSLALLLLVSCKNFERTGRVIHKIEMEPVAIDSTSIRALETRDGNYWFAGSKGVYGQIDQDVNTGVIVYEDNRSLEFRSIAVTSQFTFILTAGNPALIYRIEHANDSIALVYQEEGEGVFYDSMKFWNDKEGIAIGDPQEGCFSIITTINGGDTWNKMDCTMLPEIIEGEAAYAASNSNIALYNDHIWIATGGQAARILHSPDKGNTWEVQDTPIMAGGTMTGIYAIDFYDENQGVVVGGDWDNKNVNTSNKAITYDGGATWELMADASGPGYCSDITFIPGTDGKELLAVGSPGVWWSGNRGTDWKQLTTEGFYTVAFEDSSQGMLAGPYKLSRFNLLSGSSID